MKKTNFILKHGIKNGKRVHINDVESGLQCNCTCFCCGESLIAKKGNQVQPHFAHKSGKDCQYLYETYIHFQAKEIIERVKKILLPVRKQQFNERDLSEIVKAKREQKKLGEIKYKTFEVSTVKLERKLHNIVPDIIATINNRPFLIEIAVTSFVKEEKLEKIKQIGLPVLEIDLSDIPRSVPITYLEQVVIDGAQNKKWIYNPKENKIDLALEMAADEIFEMIKTLRKQRFKRGTKKTPYISSCPKTYVKKASIENHCRNCEYLFSESEKYILCFGENAKIIRELLKQKNIEISNTF